MNDLTVLLAFGVLALIFVAFEIAGLTVSGAHTLSWWAHNYQPLRYLILIGFALTPIWWFIHSGREIPR